MRDLEDRIIAASGLDIRVGRGIPSTPVGLEMFLEDLTKNKAVLPLALKEEYLAEWVEDERYINTDFDDPIETYVRELIIEFAALEPVVDLAALEAKVA